MLKHWIAWIFKIPQTFIARYKNDGKNILIISTAVRGKKTEIKRYLVEHLLDEKMDVTQETFTQEKSHFPDLLD